jgi:hypothetical protein
MKRLLIFILSVLLLASLAVEAGRFLVVDSPQHSDVILVLAGETNRRPQRALQLLAGDYGTRIILDVLARTRIYANSVGAEIHSGSAPRLVGEYLFYHRVIHQGGSEKRGRMPGAHRCEKRADRHL